MLEAAVARPKRDQTRVLGIGERHARLGDALQPGGRRVALEHERRRRSTAMSPRRASNRDLARCRRAGRAPPATARRALPERPRPARRPWRRPASGRTRAARRRAMLPDRRDCGSPRPASRTRRRSSMPPTIRRAAQGRAPPRAGGSARRAPAPADISRSRCRFSSVTSSAATARTLIRSSRISTGSPRRSAVIASPRRGRRSAAVPAWPRLCLSCFGSSTLFSFAAAIIWRAGSRASNLIRPHLCERSTAA